MTNSSINLVFHHESTLPHQHVTSLVRPVRHCASFNLNYETIWGVKVTSKAQRLKVYKQLVRNSSISSEIVIASDEKYGNKQVVSLTPRLYDYVLENVREPEVRIDEDTHYWFIVFVDNLITYIAFARFWFHGLNLWLPLCLLSISMWYQLVVFQILRQLRAETASMHGSQMQVYRIILLCKFICTAY